MSKRTVAIPLCVLAAGGLAGGAYAATQASSNPQQSFLNDVAHRLHVSPARLSAAVRQAFIDRINAAVAAGHLTAAQARAIEQRIDHAAGLSWLLRAGAPGPVVAPRAFGFHMPMPAVFGPPGILTSAASYLGLTQTRLLQELRSGKSLAQIASAQGKSKAGLEKAITTTLESQLEKAVSAGHLPRAVERRLLSGLTEHVQAIVNGQMRGVPFMMRGGPGMFRGGPGMPPGPGGPAERRQVPLPAYGFGGPPAAQSHRPIAPQIPKSWF